MSQRVTFAELVNLAIGTPEMGNVNFNALHFLLHSMLQHLQLQDEPKEISEDELDFIQPPTSKSPVSIVPSEPDALGRRPSSIFHQMQERIATIERQLQFLNGSPSTTDLLARTQTDMTLQPTQDMWQMMQLRKKMELNEEGMTKAMSTLQDLLRNICELKVSTQHFKEDLGQLKSNFQRLDVDKVQEQLKQLDDQAKEMEEIRRQVSYVHEEKGVKERTMPDRTMPDLSDVVRWGSLCEMLLGQSSLEMEREDRDQLSREVLASLGELPEKHRVLAAKIAEMEEQMKRQAEPQAEQPGLSESLAEDGSEVMSLLERMSSLEIRDQQRRDSLKGVLEQMPELKGQCDKLEGALEKLKRTSFDIQNIHNTLERLDVTKADKTFIQEEMNVKADKSALEAKVNYVELSSATSQLNEMMQELLQKMSLQDKDWQAALQKLFTDMDCKLDRMALDPLAQQLEEVWHFIKKHLSEGPSFDADSAAGFKKQLFERVKCLSCDRPVNLMTGPHLITIRKATLRPRPASANGYEYLGQKQKRDSETNEASDSKPPQTCWQCQAHHQTCTIKRVARARDFATLYPYGDPTLLTYDNAEVDILGVNGVLYKGRVNPQAVEQTLVVQKEFLGMKPPQPPSKLRMERAHSAIANLTYVSPYASSTVRRSRSAVGTHRLPPPSETMDRIILNNTSINQRSFQNGGGVTGV